MQVWVRYCPNLVGDFRHIQRLMPDKAGARGNMHSEDSRDWEGPKCREITADECGLEASGRWGLYKWVGFGSPRGRRQMSGGRPQEVGTMVEMSCRKSVLTGACICVLHGRWEWRIWERGRLMNVLSPFMSKNTLYSILTLDGDCIWRQNFMLKQVSLRSLKVLLHCFLESSVAFGTSFGNILDLFLFSSEKFWKSLYADILKFHNDVSWYGSFFIKIAVWKSMSFHQENFNSREFSYIISLLISSHPFFPSFSFSVRPLGLYLCAPNTSFTIFHQLIPQLTNWVSYIS